MINCDIKETFKSFENQNILIIGDVMIDSYLWGEVDRISPEAPVPIVAVNKRENRMGGAANVALNIQAMGAKPILFSVIGFDQKGDEFLHLLHDAQMTTKGILRSNNRRTTTKFRVLGNKVQMLRVDEEDIHPLNISDCNRFIDNCISYINAEKIDAVIFQDYDKGVINKEIIGEITSLCNKKNIPVIVDPKKNNFLDYKDVTLFKPNLKELREGLNIEIQANQIDTIKRASDKLQAILNNKITLVTLSEFGVFVQKNDPVTQSTEHIPAHQRSISDVSGAGDTVISVAALCLAAGLSPIDMAAISNLSGGLVCEEAGVVPVNKERLLNEVLKL
ncbi:MAG: hypothetical protein JEZ03_10810 [Bacteroidales bacterium]|nr:hypothetical protein [Bacteroidales bacterium]